MSDNRNIQIKNIYYMLAYAFQVLRKSNYDSISKESFERVHDLFAEILYRGITEQLKRGLYREYINRDEDVSTLRGKLVLSRTLQNKMQKKQMVSCEYDDLSVNNIFNQILKTTTIYLIKEPLVDKHRKDSLKSILPYFSTIDVIDHNSIHWSTLYFQRNNKSYQMLISICYFILDGMLMTTDEGEYKMATFSDEHMNKLFERFVLEYYRKEYSGILSSNASTVDWAIDDYESSTGLWLMPKMQSDIMLRYKDLTHIIDTKYYGTTLQKRFEKMSFHSSNLYQIMAYVNNHDVNNTGKVSGMLLYAKTTEDVSPDLDTSIKGNRYLVKTLDLNVPFESIRQQLDNIVQTVFDL